MVGFESLELRRSIILCDTMLFQLLHGITYFGSKNTFVIKPVNHSIPRNHSVPREPQYTFFLYCAGTLHILCAFNDMQTIKIALTFW